MKTKYTFMILAFYAAYLCTSCGDFLEIKPDKSIVVPSRLVDYQALLDNNTIMNAGTGHQLGEISGDNYHISKAAWENLTRAFQRNAYLWEKDIFEGELSTDWNDPSLVILYSNLALQGVEKTMKDDRNLSDWNNLKGGALFFRAHAFYQLAQLFCDTYKPTSASQDLGIPLRLESDITLPTVRSTVEQTYRQILTDLTEASELLPLVPVFKTRPSKPAAHALLSRVYLQMGSYENALHHASLALDDFNSLMDYNIVDTTINFPFARYNDEVIFHSHMSSPTILNQNRLQVAEELLEGYDGDDLRKPCFFRESNGTTVYRGSYYGSNAFFTGLSSNEVYMIAAECHARLGNTSQALEQLNTLLASRYRRGKFVAIEETNPQILLDVILEERRKELPFRGLRWSDLKRLNLEPRYSKALERVWENQTVVVLEPNSSRYIFPIPDAVIEITGIEQNER